MASKSPTEFSALFSPNWDAPTEKERELYAAVGSALSSWTLLEWQATLIHMSITHANGDAPLGAFASFSSVSSFDARIKMIDYALLYTLPTKSDEAVVALDGWRKLSARLQGKTKKRHQLAHGVVEGEKNGHGPFWIPFAHYAGIIVSELRDQLDLHPDVKPLRRMSASDIANRDRSFQRLHDDLKQYREKVLFPLMHQLSLKRQRREGQTVTHPNTPQDNPSPDGSSRG